MEGVIVFVLIAATAAAIWYIRKSRSAAQRTGRISREDDDPREPGGGSQRSRTASGLPPIRRPGAAVRLQTGGAAQPARLPSYRRRVENIYEFPHCPKCWSKNRPGEPQTVFWRPDASCYRCVRGHRFRRNGTLIV